MRKVNLILILSLIILGIGFPVFAQNGNIISEANNQFAFDLYSSYKSEAANVFFSSYSIISALSITFEAAKGETAEQMQAVLHLPGDAFLRREAFLKSNQEINKPDKKYKLSLANALWAQEDYGFLDDYSKLIAKYYSGQVKNLDFKIDPEKSRLTINSWVEENTNRKIKNLIPPRVINPLTSLIITNAIYFKGLWLKPFNKKDTTDSDFNITPDNKIKVKMMCLTGKDAEFNYAETDMFKIVELPYEGSDLSMLIILPKEGDLKPLEDVLTTEQFLDWRGMLKENRVNIYLPRFKFETKYFMADKLKNMGMQAAFSKDADFSGMTGKKDLFISDVIHQAFVEVNEEGTEAAAATAIAVSRKAMGPDKIKEFKADHPFIFIIQERITGNILFIGRVNDPSV